MDPREWEKIQIVLQDYGIPDIDDVGSRIEEIQSNLSKFAAGTKNKRVMQLEEELTDLTTAQESYLNWKKMEAEAEIDTARGNEILQRLRNVLDEEGYSSYSELMNDYNKMSNELKELENKDCKKGIRISEIMKHLCQLMSENKETLLSALQCLENLKKNISSSKISDCEVPQIRDQIDTFTQILGNLSTELSFPSDVDEQGEATLKCESILASNSSVDCNRDSMSVSLVLSPNTCQQKLPHFNNLPSNNSVDSNSAPTPSSSIVQPTSATLTQVSELGFPGAGDQRDDATLKSEPILVSNHSVDSNLASKPVSKILQPITSQQNSPHFNNLESNNSVDPSRAPMPASAILQPTSSQPDSDDFHNLPTNYSVDPNCAMTPVSSMLQPTTSQPNSTARKMLASRDSVDSNSATLQVRSRSSSLSKRQNNRHSTQLQTLPQNPKTIMHSGTRNIRRIQEMPDCAEKTVRSLLAHFQKIKKGRGSFLTEAEVCSYLDGLQQQFFKERVQGGTQLKQLRRIMDLRKEPSNPKQNQEYQAALSKLSKELFPVDLAKLLELVNLNRDNLNPIEDKNVVILLGDTGAGKSLTLHFLASSKIEMTKEGLVIVKCKDELEMVVTKASHVSVTRTIVPVLVEYDGGTKSCIFCDAPGFEDTAGPEQDIANGITISHSLRKCKSLKPLILLSKNTMGNRWEGTEKMALLLDRLFDSFDIHLESCSLIFTKYAKDEFELMLNQAKLVLKEIEEEEEKGEPPREQFRKMLSFVISEMSQNRALILNPITDSREDILRILEMKTPLGKLNCVLKDTASQVNINHLKSQLQHDLTRLKAAIEESDVPFLVYKTTQLVQLSKVVALDECVHSVTLAKDSLHDSMKQTVCNFEKTLSSFSSLPHFKDSDCVDLQHLFEKLSMYQRFYEQVSDTDTFPRPKEQAELLIQQVSCQLSDKIHSMFNLTAFIQEERYPWNSIISGNLHKLKSFEQLGVRNFYSTCCDLLDKEVENIIHSAKKWCEETKNYEAFEGNDIKQFDNFLMFLSNANTNLSDHIQQQIFLQEYEQSFFGWIGEKKDTAHFILSKTTTDCEIAELEEALNILALLRSVAAYTTCGDSYLDLRDLRQPFEQCFCSASDLFQNAFTELQIQIELFDEPNALIDFSRVSSLFIILRKLLDNSDLEAKHFKDFVTTQNIIEKCVGFYKQSLINLVHITDTSTAEFQRLWRNLCSCELVSDELRLIVSKAVQDVKEAVKVWSMKLVQSIHLTVEEMQPPGPFEQFQKIDWMFALHECLKLESEQHEQQNKFRERIQTEVSSIISFFSSADDFTNFSRLLNMLVFYDALTGCKFAQDLLSPDKFYEATLKLISSFETCCSSMENDFERVFMKFELLKAEVNVSVLVNTISLNLEMFISMKEMSWASPSDSQVQIAYNRIFIEIPCEVENKWFGHDGLLSKHLEVLDLFVAHSQELNDLYALLASSKVCLPFDKFTSIDEHLRSYKNIVLQLESEIEKIVKGQESELESCIITHDYTRFDEVAKRLNLKDPSVRSKFMHVLERAKSQILSQSEEINCLVEQLPAEPHLAVSCVQQITKKIKVAKLAPVVFEYFEESEAMKAGDENLRNTERKFQSHFSSFFKIISGALENNMFSKAENNLNSIGVLVEQVALNTPELRYSFDETVVFHHFLNNEMQKVNGSIVTHFKTLETFYSTATQEQLETSNAKYIFEELRRASHTNKAMYDNFYRLLDIAMCQGIERILNATSSSNELDDTDEKIKLLRALLRTLPDDAGVSLKKRLDDLENEARQQISEIEAELQAIGSDLQGMLDKLDLYFSSNRMVPFEKFKTLFRSTIFTTCAKFDGLLQNNELSQILKSLPSILEKWLRYFAQLEEFQKKSQRTKGFVSHLFRDEECLQRTRQIISQTNSCLLALCTHSNEEPKLSTLHLFFADLVQYAISVECSPYFQSAYEDDIFKALAKAGSFFDSHQKLSQECFDSLEEAVEAHVLEKNLLECANIMDETLKHESCFTDAERYASLQVCHERTPQFETQFKACWSYKQMQDLLSEQFVKSSKIVMTKILECEEALGLNATVRDDLYEKLHHHFKTLLLLKENGFIARHFDSNNSSKVLEDCEQHLRSQILEISSHLIAMLAGKEGEQNVFTISYIDPADDKEIYKKFNALLDNLRAINEKFKYKPICDLAAVQQKEVHVFLESSLEDVSKQLTELIIEENVEKFVTALLQLKVIAIKISTCGSTIEKKIVAIVNTVQKSKPSLIQQIYLTLDQHTQSDIAKRIIADTPTFEKFSIEMRYRKCAAFTVDKILEDTEFLRSSHVHIDMLLIYYQAFDDTYKDLVNKGLLHADFLPNLSCRAHQIALSTVPYQQKVIALMAHIFAYWTLKHYYEKVYVPTESTNTKDGTEETKDSRTATPYLLQPLPAQIIAIVRLLSIDDADDREIIGISGEGTKTLETGADHLSEEHSKQKSNSFISSVKHMCQVIKEKFTAQNIQAENAQMHPPQKIPTKHLVEIKTGEGKSVILAVTAIILALLGFEVSCACYSEYLSDRDFQSFFGLFDAFEVKQQINYGTFHKLLENFINREGDIRKMVNSILTHSQGFGEGVQEGGALKNSVLLIDEVDVFFTKDFYGNMYRPFASITGDAIDGLIRHIWNVRKDRSQSTFEAVRVTQIYKDCASLFPEWLDVLVDCVKKMLVDVKTFHSSEYIVGVGDNADKIGYKDQDGISYNITDGYKTLFAYFEELEAHKITAKTLQSKIALLISCGNFSYAEVPKQFSSIIGVSGTLQTLNPAQTDLLENEYKIMKKTFIPSMYGHSKMTWRPDDGHDCVIVKEKDFNAHLTLEILERSKGTMKQRAVLVFFSTKAKLLKFYNSQDLRNSFYKDGIKILTEEASSSEKEATVKSAVLTGNITLLTREFGRGTDFICYDDDLNTSGGIHVIQTFVSEDIAEEKQIMGRTARQGNKGSFSMLVIAEELQMFDISENEVPNLGNKYSLVDQKRQEFFNIAFPESIRHVGEIKDDHRNSLEFVQNLKANQFDNVMEFLKQRNKFVGKSSGGVCRTMILMDATGSMGHLITKSKNTVSLMFSRLLEVLEFHKCEVTVEMQFVCFRNYDCRIEEILQHSAWETSAESLRIFMERIKAQKGTHWEEAVELALLHACEEHSTQPVDQVVLIGDAAPNKREQVSQGRARFGENYWSSTRFKTSTYYKDILELMKEQRIPVHAFYVRESAKKSFQEISESAGEGGSCGFLQINDAQGAEQLTDCVSKIVLSRSGGEELGYRMVKYYEEKYGRL